MLHKESHNLSNEDDIARHPKLLKNLSDHLRNEIGTICERQMMRAGAGRRRSKYELTLHMPKLRDGPDDGLESMPEMWKGNRI
ncbi:MAG: hypothetical protein WBD09_03305 [Halobacteriota archaeon]